MSTLPVALITGGSQRLGKAIAEALHKANYDIIIHYNHSDDAASALADTLNAKREQSCCTIKASFDNLEEIKSLGEQSEAFKGRVDLLVNNASSFFPTPIGSATPEDWDNLFNSNSKAPFFLSQTLAPTLKKNQGNIINMIDIHGSKPLKEHTVYCMAKSSLQMMTLSLAKELAPDVRVNGIAPGAILWPTNTPTIEEQENILSGIPLGRQGMTEDIANAAVFFATSPYITGQILSVDGGRSL